MAKMRPEQRKRLPRFEPAVADDAYVMLETIEADRWIDIEEPAVPDGEWAAWIAEPDNAARWERWHEISAARARVVNAALVEYARLYTGGKADMAERARKLLKQNEGQAWWRRHSRVQIRVPAVNSEPATGFRWVSEWEYSCKLCGKSLATVSHEKADGHLPAGFWLKLRRHGLHCSALLVVETYELHVWAERQAASKEKNPRARNIPQPEPRIYTAAPPTKI